ncbi:2-amino-4-hydroxy-6-hydroxymethyldihydropteridine diphosphokinase [Comamonas composti]|uniref:2-amino-4-hydroxy-6- hydroxymethyldihydropteridine diphosphokinase n=1 Tax=Comamonas composti TaxID=408558 RepID=UPI000420C42D|nr:2-amino-4-hydroxy-6-hydroxymethyldihydropteridine diphosphokinase [Comamonas composti]
MALPTEAAVHETVAIGLGANLGDMRRVLAEAVQAIAQLEQTRLLAVSSLYRTAPVNAGGDDYLNAVALVHTRMQPLAFLHSLQALEERAGRERPYRNAPRPLDLDIELWGGRHMDAPELQIPHPRMHERAFVLVPLAEIAPGCVTPAQLQAVAGQRIEVWLAQGWENSSI